MDGDLLHHLCAHAKLQLFEQITKLIAVDQDVKRKQIYPQNPIAGRWLRRVTGGLKETGS
jgi:hypothetical protein